MGEKGSRRTRHGDAVADGLAADLAPLGDVTSRAMFGGHGVFHDGVMFAIVDADGVVFLRADASTAGEFEEAGSSKHGKMPYWEVPPEIHDDHSLLLAWAAKARDVAHAAKR